MEVLTRSSMTYIWHLTCSYAVSCTHPSKLTTRVRFSSPAPLRTVAVKGISTVKVCRQQSDIGR